MTMRLPGVLILIAFISLSIVGCSEKPQVATPSLPEVYVSKPLKKEVTQFLEFTGTTAALEFVEVRARVEGWLQSIHFESGARVKKGDLLFVIDPRPFQAQVDQAQAALKGKEADLQLKQANLKRAQQLLASASISQLQYDIQNADESVALAQVGIAKADLEKAKLDLAYTQLTAPIDGRVSRNMVDIGNLVGAKDKTLLTEIVNDSSVYVYFDVSERDILMLIRKFPNIEREAESDRNRAPAYLQLADETGYPHEGRIDFVDPRVDPSTGTLRVRAIFANDKGLLVSGLFGRIRVPIEKKDAVLVPETAVGIGQGGRYVLLVNKDNVVELRPVKTGQLEGTLRVIQEGLTKDDWVVVNAIQRARPGLKVAPKESSISAPSQETGKAAPSSGK
ncbi:efflux RND transporter periplasmic adaptor subunit [Desulfomonile tiedjei]|uniref:RND family efflux transporter, MFP subunit n=1 Tax=Desulfomonile tiedjei (strain ATCC 49306 / DSM 6799 / DCB-1) TaxID=706587 RepID=I4C5S3_DESTA|nr:efflux RND transporter periplasmic adaptor subunit [Desulfomonile tiedjei]AFM24914.1 RND family efflux transporter, MFP subunit [Desulfomonile tiedjei DSM 6799]